MSRWPEQAEALLPEVWSWLDGRSLIRASWTARRWRSSVATAAPTVARERHVRESVAAGTASATLLGDVFVRMEASAVWESFESAATGWERRWTRAPSCYWSASSGRNGHRRARGEDDEAPGPWRYAGLGSEDGALRVAGGGEANFSGLYRRLSRPTRPRRIAFRYKVARRCQARAFCNVFFSTAGETRPPCRFFTAGEPDVFTFLLPVGVGQRAQLWLPGIERRANVLDLGAHLDDEWHFVDARFAWFDDPEGHPHLYYVVTVDGVQVVEDIGGALLPTDYDAIRSVYVFNWVTEFGAFDDDYFDDDDDDDDDVPDCRVADLVIEDALPQHLLSTADAAFEHNATVLFHDTNSHLNMLQFVLAHAGADFLPVQHHHGGGLGGAGFDDQQDHDHPSDHDDFDDAASDDDGHLTHDDDLPLSSHGQGGDHDSLEEETGSTS